MEETETVDVTTRNTSLVMLGIKVGFGVYLGYAAAKTIDTVTATLMKPVLTRKVEEINRRLDKVKED